MVHVAWLQRFPVKGLSPEPLDALSLTASDGLAGDRAWALALGSTRFDPQAPAPLDKGHFLMLRANEALASLRSTLDERAVLRVRRDGQEVLEAPLGEAGGREAASAFFTDFAGEASRGRIKVVSAPGHRFTDVSVVSPAMMRAVSVVNLATVRALGEAIGAELDPLRFRANIHIDGLDPWAELGWIDRAVQIGTLRLRAVRQTRRCAAIDVDPGSGRRDLPLTRRLFEHAGHPNLGIYLAVEEDGAIGLGDAVLA